MDNKCHLWLFFRKQEKKNHPFKLLLFFNISPIFLRIQPLALLPGHFSIFPAVWQNTRDANMGYIKVAYPPIHFGRKIFSRQQSFTYKKSYLKQSGEDSSQHFFNCKGFHPRLVLSFKQLPTLYSHQSYPSIYLFRWLFWGQTEGGYRQKQESLLGGKRWWWHRGHEKKVRFWICSIWG